MANQQLINYIKSNLQRGLSIEQIKQSLLAAGWSNDNVNEAIDIVTQQSISPSPSLHEESAKKSPRKRSLLLTLWLFFILAGNFVAIIGYFLFTSIIRAQFPHVPLWTFYLLGLLALGNFIFIIFLFKWKKWAFFTLCLSAIIALMINIILGINFLLTIAGLAGPVILYLILRRKWDLLEGANPNKIQILAMIIFLILSSLLIFFSLKVGQIPVEEMTPEQLCELTTNSLLCKAIVTKDANLCKEVTPIDTPAYKPEHCYCAIAKLTENQDLCEKVKSRSKDCYSDIAISTNNIDLCNKITVKTSEGEDYSEYYQQECKAIIDQDPDLCDKESCYHNVVEKLALITQNIEFCEKTHPLKKKYCYQELAIGIGDIDMCKKAHDAGNTKPCESIIKKDLELCKETKFPEHCYGKIVSLIGDATLCKKAPNPRICYEAVIYKKIGLDIPGNCGLSD